MSLSTEIVRLQQAKSDLKAAINALGGSITDETLDKFAEVIQAMPSALETLISTHNSSATAHEDIRDELSSKLTVGSYTFNDGASIGLTAGSAEYRAAAAVSSLTVTYPTLGYYEAWISFTTASSGTVTVTLPSSKYIGGAPTFGNGETWEISIKDGVVIAAKCE